jgi:hypothetical protein
MMITFKSFLVLNNYRVDCDGVVVLNHAVAVSRISFALAVCRSTLSVGAIQY